MDDPEDSLETDSSATLVAPLASATDSAEPPACSDKQGLPNHSLGRTPAAEICPVPRGTSKQSDVMHGGKPDQAALGQLAKACWHQGDPHASYSQEQAPPADASTQQDNTQLQEQHSSLAFADEGAHPALVQSGSFHQTPTDRQTRVRQVCAQQVHRGLGSQEGLPLREPLNPQASNGSPIAIANAAAEKQVPSFEAASGSKPATGTPFASRATQQAVRSSKAHGKATGQGLRAAAPLQGGAGSLSRPASRATRLPKSHRSPASPASAAETAGAVRGLHQGKPLQTGKPAARAVKGLHQEKPLQTGKRPLARHSVMIPTGSAAASHHRDIPGPEHVPSAPAVSLDAAQSAQTDVSREPQIALQEASVELPKSADASSRSAATLDQGVAGDKGAAAVDARTFVRATAASQGAAPASPRAAVAVPRPSAASPKAVTLSPRATASSSRPVSAHQAAARSRLPFVSTTRIGKSSQPNTAHVSAPRSPTPAVLPAKRRCTAHSASHPKCKSLQEQGSKAEPVDQSQPVLLLDTLNSAVHTDLQPLSQTDNAGGDAHQEVGPKLHAQDVSGDTDVSAGQAAKQQSLGQNRMQSSRAPATRAWQSTAVFEASEHSSDMAGKHTQLAVAHSADSPAPESPLQLQLVNRQSSDGESHSESQHSSDFDGSSICFDSQEELDGEAHKAASSAWDQVHQPDSVGRVAQLFMMRVRAKLVFQVGAAVWLAKVA